MNEEIQFARNRRSRVSSFIIHPSCFQSVATVPPNFTPRLGATGNGEHFPSAFSNARSLAASNATLDLPDLNNRVSARRLAVMANVIVAGRDE